ncbi:hypothetical protein ACIQD3_16610 [Peribacillus loiseleuriae]|uniref:hypothetical protein n=1 Tax=Peribacillus loiseleuriae TaxID=1679170 RepID=UPI00380E7987
MGYISRSYSDDCGEYYHKKGGCKKDHHEKKDECPNKGGREVVDFDFSNQAGSASLTALVGTTTPEQIIGELDFHKACSGDLVWLSGSSEVSVTLAGLLDSVTFRIRKVKKHQNTPLQSAAIYTRTLSIPVAVAGLSTFFVPIDFVDVLSHNDDGVSYILTVSSTAVVAITGTVANTTFTGTEYR